MWPKKIKYMSRKTRNRNSPVEKISAHRAATQNVKPYISYGVMMMMIDQFEICTYFELEV